METGPDKKVSESSKKLESDKFSDLQDNFPLLQIFQFIKYLEENLPIFPKHFHLHSVKLWKKKKLIFFVEKLFFFSQLFFYPCFFYTHFFTTFLLSAISFIPTFFTLAFFLSSFFFTPAKQFAQILGVLRKSYLFLEVYSILTDGWMMVLISESWRFLACFSNFAHK